jgi:hypothetical protein
MYVSVCSDICVVVALPLIGDTHTRDKMKNMKSYSIMFYDTTPGCPIMVPGKYALAILINTWASPTPQTPNKSTIAQQSINVPAKSHYMLVGSVG